MNKYTTFISIFFLLGLIIIVGAIYYRSDTTYNIPSTFSLSPTPIPSPTKALEPFVGTWATYNNDKYNFTIDYPSNWIQQEYDQQSGFRIAFSPNTLPCKDCTYVHEGYYSVRVYNQKTDSLSYTDFTTRMKNAGKSKDYLLIRIDDKSAVLFANTVALENNGWVYEISLDTNNGNENVIDSKLFQKAATSLKFTYLLFNN